MLRYNYMGQVLEIKLPEECGYEEYSVECRYLFNKQIGKYLLSMWLRHNSADDKFKIDSQEIDTQLISGTKETIQKNICKIVEHASLSGFFTPYIERYQYTYDCFNRGNTLYEDERMCANE